MNIFIIPFIPKYIIIHSKLCFEMNLRSLYKWSLRVVSHLFGWRQFFNTSSCTFVFLNLFFSKRCYIRFLEVRLLGRMGNICVILLTTAELPFLGTLSFYYLSSSMLACLQSQRCQHNRLSQFYPQGYRWEAVPWCSFKLLYIIMSKSSSFQKVMGHLHFFICKLPFICLDYFSLDFQLLSALSEALHILEIWILGSEYFSKFVIFLVAL